MVVGAKVVVVVVGAKVVDVVVGAFVVVVVVVVGAKVVVVVVGAKVVVVVVVAPVVVVTGTAAPGSTTRPPLSRRKPTDSRSRTMSGIGTPSAWPTCTHDVYTQWCSATA